MVLIPIWAGAFLDGQGFAGEDPISEDLVGMTCFFCCSSAVESGGGARLDCPHGSSVYVFEER
jgi:hypothetical protein